jgi:hypothetical protein
MKYEFGSKVYVQNKLVWGQVKQLASILKDITFEGDITVSYLINLLDDKLMPAVAVVITEEGTSIKNKDIDKIAEELEETIPVDVVIQVVEDFFTCNPVSSLLEKAGNMMKNLNTNLNQEDLTTTTTTE